MRALQDIASTCWPTGRWHIGGLTWSLTQHGRTDWPTLVLDHAWGWLSAPGELELGAHPDHPEEVEHLLDWADPRTVTILDSETHLARALHRRGLRPRPGPFFQRLVHDLTDLPEPRLPPGHHLDHVTDPDVPARVAAHRAAFHPSRVTDHSYRLVRATWPYRADLDRVARTPDGSVAAYCLAWLDERTGVGELEPVGTHPDHRRRGLAAAVSLDALHRLRAAGARTVVVHPRGDDAYPVPRHLYTALGFRPTGQRTITYGR
ncbi:GNAT family N-acetyltransferase [Saccharothrix coeruleofusca]|uniref:N-acetyltransferase domain-containing protein n=1 Tax=Saccharothrix coeruleofusca TaxID=33919 RepID=A0A918ALS3_9PSEU|nr:GNAT family N-acetyltransferase [Saccharothrix coeruleofusca]MBP2336320.1 ribosomal protein S18 acetylase RimI-like enzyme [Saccharothrix coeruleofusca]GGP53907.1 hypothetical protein GCM10010185_27800 [Saccharothrix coeruleofusca]